MTGALIRYKFVDDKGRIFTRFTHGEPVHRVPVIPKRNDSFLKDALPTDETHITEDYRMGTMALRGARSVYVFYYHSDITEEKALDVLLGYVFGQTLNISKKHVKETDEF